MTQPNWMDKIGATPGKLALIGVLAVVLVTVISGQLSDGSTTSAVASRRRTSSRTPATRPSVIHQQKSRSAKQEPSIAKTAPSDEPQRQLPIVWPKISIEQIASYDPLLAPDWLLAASNATPLDDKRSQAMAEAERQKRITERLELLRRQGTIAVVISAGEKRAIIGDKSVQLGDSIEGFQITDITKQGVILRETK